ncbi:hypothetical protein A2U01_0097369, partial [Trifolium medium]|nr:hypothetical protein [Trifolium medium]
MQGGIEPINMLLERSKICKAGSLQSCGGMYPWNLFRANLRIWIKEKSSPIDE